MWVWFTTYCLQFQPWTDMLFLLQPFNLTSVVIYNYLLSSFFTKLGQFGGDSADNVFYMHSHEVLFTKDCCSHQDPLFCLFITKDSLLLESFCLDMQQESWPWPYQINKQSFLHKMCCSYSLIYHDFGLLANKYPLLKVLITCHISIFII